MRLAEILKEIEREASRSRCRGRRWARRGERATLDEMSREEILQAALALPPDERVRLSVELLESVEPAEGGLSAAWLAEIERRDAALARGEVETVDADEVLAEYGMRLDP